MRLADQGAWITLAARDAQRLDVLAAECRQRGGKAIALPTDLTDKAQCKALIERAVARFRRLHVLINNAGIGATGLLEELPDLALFKRLMDKNGTPRGPQGRAIYNQKPMTADQCAAITLKAATRRRREVLMGPGWLDVWLRIIAPGLADKITIEMVLKPVVRRAKKAQSTG